MQLAFSDYGEGQPLVILHGLFGSARNWSSIAKQMGRQRRILAVDLRNHGSSPWTQTHSYEEMAQDLAEFFDQQGLDQADVIGHSMGGKAVMTLALLHPEKVRSLVIADIAPVERRDFAFKGFAKAMMDVDLACAQSRGDVDKALSLHIDDPMIRAFLLGNLKTTGDGFAWQMNLETLYRDMAKIGGVPDIDPNARYTGPTLVISGSESDYVLPSHHQLFRHFFPRVQMHEIDGAGHWVHAQKPHEFMAAVTDFLAGVG